MSPGSNDSKSPVTLLRLKNVKTSERQAERPKHEALFRILLVKYFLTHFNNSGFLQICVLTLIRFKADSRFSDKTPEKLKSN